MAEVKTIAAAARIPDRIYLAIVFGNQGMIVDANKGTTRLVPLNDKNLEEGPAREAAVLESAKQTADVFQIPVVYVIEYPRDWRSGDPLPLPP